MHADLFSRHASPSEVCVFVAVDERGDPRCYVKRDFVVVDATENSKGGVAAEVCSSQAGL